MTTRLILSVFRFILDQCLRFASQLTPVQPAHSVVSKLEVCQSISLKHTPTSDRQLITMSISHSNSSAIAFYNKFASSACSARVVDLVVDTMDAVIRRNPRKANDQKTPELPVFVKSVIQRGQANVVTVMVALVYIERFKRRLPQRAIGDFDTPHRLFFVALMLASKFLNDQSLTNRAWSKVCNTLFRIDELNIMEIDFLGVIKFHLFLDHEGYTHFVQTKLRAYDHEMTTELVRLRGPLFLSNIPPVL